MTYTNSNIDLLYEDGQVANVNALADAVLHESRAINDVTFAEDAAILATDFGLVVLDDSSLQVREFRYYGKALTSAAMVGDYMIVSYGGNLYSTNARREVLADFYAIGVSQANARIYPVNDSTFFLLGTGALKRCDMDPGGRCDIVPVFAATPEMCNRPSVAGWQTSVPVRAITPSPTMRPSPRPRCRATTRRCSPARPTAAEPRGRLTLTASTSREAPTITSPMASISIALAHQ